jgi:acyl-CoA synthetase (AMP-forming)/AMP-acid ligase II
MKAGIYDRKTLPDLLVKVVKTCPQKGIGFVRSDGDFTFTTYKELFDKASSLIPGLRSKGIMQGDKVMIIMNTNEEIVPLLWSCFLSGVVPTILQPPVTFSELNQPARKIENIFNVLEHPRLIVSNDLVQVFSSDVIPSGHLIPMDKLRNHVSETFSINPRESDIAFIQFSSGSTGDPKGIILTHKNILSNLLSISVGLDFTLKDITVNWMPLYHDMGLIGYHLAPMFGQYNQYLIEPIDFIKRPSLWLDIMDKVRCTTTGCPNFGQALLLRYLKNKDNLHWDLSSIKAITNGAEPISVKIMTEFMDRLRPFKLRSESMMPVYGMAEATLAINFSELLKAPVIHSFNRTILQREGKAIEETEDENMMIELVSVGKPLSDVEIRIVDEQGHVTGERTDGLIQIKGASVTAGYYNNPEATRNSFDHDWFITGDKGFVYKGNLYITGRVKDIIFVRGQNLYAHDLENLAEKHSDISYGKVIFGGLFDPVKGQDQIILFLVGSPNPATCETFLSLRSYFRDMYGIPIDVFVPIRSNQVPKTSSGKIQRYKLISAYQNGAFDGVIAELNKLLKETHI